MINRDRNEEIAKRGDARWRQVTIDAVPSAAGMSRLTFVYARPLFALMAIVGLLLLLACTNVATLLLARGAARQREMTVRVALGAGRLRLVRQVLTESLLLAAAGCLLGIVLAYFGADALMRIVTSGRMPGMSAHIEIQPQLDLRVLLFTVGVSLATGVLFGLAPALSAWHPAPAASLRATGAAPDTPSRRLIGKGLVVAQVALSIVLLAAAGLFVRHMLTLRNVGLGFQRESVLLVTLDPAGSGYQGNQLAPIYRQLLERLAAIPGVRSATLSAVTPVSGAGASRFIEVPGFSERAEDRRRVVVELDRAEVLRNARHAIAGRARFHVRRPGTPAGGDREPVDGALLLRRSQPDRTTLHLRAAGQSGGGAGSAVPDRRRRRRHEIPEPAGADSRGWST